MTLTAEHVCKTIRNAPILQDVNLTLEGGTVYGFVGRNGSGKTMLFRALSGLMKLTQGTVSLDGQVLHRDFSVLPSLGIVLEHVGMYPNLTGVENLRYLAGLTRRAGEADIRTAIERVGLDPDDKRTYRKYSLGMKQRLAIAQAIMEKPDVLMLDEPTNGLDDDGVRKIRDLILEEKARGAIVLLASHNQEDIRILSDHLFRIDQGRLEKLS
ncbi:ABC transporter ATP-binding protein [Pseudoflavonifractor capillosus]|uniref:ABC transporter ATP-binding protein n=1 Tax=Pseudoflavonifractor capillosus TaxID=106588 RepID=UPI00195BFCC8|nr:ABC transporter ATP-binding protein [Pseudoflavonifractor capillosus]MBM6694059.1 ABC transporter ATP-binding protein [Pseudoflavonifractor capillosus]